MFILLLSNEDKKILYTQANQFLLQEEPEMQEVRLQTDGKHEAKKT